MKIKPTGYNVLVKMKKFEDVSEGGIVLASSTVAKEQKAMSIGTVVAFGPACFKNMESGVNSPEDWGVKVGDTIRFPKHAYMPLTSMDDEEPLIMIVDHEIKATVEE